MSVVNILFRNSPRINGYTFDATLEDTIEASITLTDYPVEAGARVNDHRIINPIKYYMTGAVSNNPIKPIASDIAGALTNSVSDNPYIAAVAGMAMGFLAGNNETRASSTLHALMDMMVAGYPFDVNAVDADLHNMVITRLSRTRDPSSENGLIFVAEMQELITLDRLPNKIHPSQSQLPDGDRVKSAAAATIRSGQKLGIETSDAVAFKIDEVMDAVGVDI